MGCEDGPRKTIDRTAIASSGFASGACGATLYEDGGAIRRLGFKPAPVVAARGEPPHPAPNALFKGVLREPPSCPPRILRHRRSMLRRIPSAVQHRRHETHRRRRSPRRLFMAPGVRRRSHPLPADIHTRRRPLRSLRFSAGAQSHRHRIRRSDSGVFDFLARSDRAVRPRLQEPGGF